MSENEALISDTESVGETEESKINEKVKAINLNTSAAAASGEYSEEEEQKSDACKALGNEAFKGNNFDTHFLTASVRSVSAR